MAWYFKALNSHKPALYFHNYLFVFASRNLSEQCIYSFHVFHIDFRAMSLDHAQTAAVWNNRRHPNT